MTSAGYPPDTVENLKINTFWDGIFHASTYVFTALGLYILWRYSRKNHIRWSGKLLPGTFLIGFGIFNLVEGIIDHHLLNVHHVVERLGVSTWDFAFLGSGVVFILIGWMIIRSGRDDARARGQAHP